MNLILTKGLINISSPGASLFVLEARDQTTGMLISQNTLVPAGISFGIGDEFERYEFETATFPYDVVVFENNGYYGSIIAYPDLAESIFTKLFFMDGKYTTHFEKVSDITSFRGERIIVWKVNV